MNLYGFVLTYGGSVEELDGVTIVKLHGNIFDIRITDYKKGLLSILRLIREEVSQRKYNFQLPLEYVNTIERIVGDDTIEENKKQLFILIYRLSFMKDIIGADLSFVLSCFMNVAYETRKNAVET